jgi:hypothetical protein
MWWRRARAAAVVAGLLAAGGLGGAAGTWAATPPPERGDLAIDEMAATSGGFEMTIRNAGRAPQAVALVVVNDAVWPSELAPRTELQPGESARASLSYVWIEGERYELKVIGSRGSVATGDVRPGADDEQAGDWPLIGALRSAWRGDR